MAKAMKAMKAMAAMKAMRAMKKAVSKIAKGRMAKVVVFREEQLHQGLDYCCPEGQEGFGPEGLRRNQEGLSSLQEGQGTLPVNIREHAEAAAQGVGMSTPLERS